MTKKVKMIRVTQGWYVVDDRWNKLTPIIPKYIDALVAAREQGEVDLVWITAGDRPTCVPSR